MVARFANVRGDLLSLDHRLSSRRERFLLARLDGEAGQLVVRVPREFRFGFGRRDTSSLGLERPLRVAKRSESASDPPRETVQSAVGVDQGAVRRRVRQRALVVLAMNLDK